MLILQLMGKGLVSLQIFSQGLPRKLISKASLVGTYIMCLIVALPCFRRTTLLLYLVSTMGECFVLEQPSGSVLEYHRTFRNLLLNHFLLLDTII